MDFPPPCSGRKKQPPHHANRWTLSPRRTEKIIPLYVTPRIVFHPQTWVAAVLKKSHDILAEFEKRQETQLPPPPGRESNTKKRTRSGQVGGQKQTKRNTLTLLRLTRTGWLPTPPEQPASGAGRGTKGMRRGVGRSRPTRDKKGRGTERSMTRLYGE